jgi:hypothetical protein
MEASGAVEEILARRGRRAARRWPRWAWWVFGPLALLLLHQSIACVFTSARIDCETAIAGVALGGDEALWPPASLSRLPAAERGRLVAAARLGLAEGRAGRAEMDAAEALAKASAGLLAALETRDGEMIVERTADYQATSRALSNASQALRSSAAASLPPSGEDGLRCWPCLWPPRPGSSRPAGGERADPAGATADAADSRVAALGSLRQRASKLAAAELAYLDARYGEVSSVAELATLPEPRPGFEAEKLRRARARFLLCGRIAAALDLAIEARRGALERQAQLARLSADR